MYRVGLVNVLILLVTGLIGLGIPTTTLVVSLLIYAKVRRIEQILERHE